MRRGLWLAAGAVLGVAGYRRATRLVDGLTRGAVGGAARPAQAGRDALASRPRPPGRAAPSRPAGAAAPRAAAPVARIGAAVGFVRDVRAGAAEYRDLHHRELARNLGGRNNRTLSG